MKNILLLFFILSFSACQDRFEADHLLGRWNTLSWYEVKTKNEISHKMNFDFKSDARYSIDYGSYLEEGKFWISGDVLFTKEDENAQKKVRILALSKDTLRIEMNRSGIIEQVLLARP